MLRSTHKHEVPAEVRKRVVSDLKNGLSPRAVADDLNKRKVKSPSGKSWYPNQVFVIMVEDTPFKSMKDLRKKHPLKSRAVKDQPARRTEALPKKKATPSRKKTAATRKSGAANHPRTQAGRSHPPHRDRQTPPHRTNSHGPGQQEQHPGPPTQRPRTFTRSG